MKKKIGVVLSGCGVYDGAEVHESVITLLAIERAGAEAVCMAPNTDQLHVINHLTGQESQGEKRNVLVESARIARGDIQDIAEVKADDLDALIFPGGFGAAKNLCDFAVKGENCDVHPEVRRLVKEFEQKQKPQAVCCIAPAMMAKIYEDSDAHPTLTIGNDAETSSKMEALGTRHQNAAVTETVIDAPNRIVSTPAYMLGQSIGEVATGIEKTVNELVKMI
ncbi:MAG: isoprenoid biosynthesis glyoxalase ElbB [Nitrospinaceae bacterium]|nr:isoprenoid biosynthesis glyoxalase ElbB [Nitrospinaceae bacterium]NIR56197.1 isoprenoid biosynthesis glyoxalase ElbB [Nitrospinaceae bacterium]NIS86653.1 isoprenoid biosynthesis glyoxalase ElbB [Nitrospinaceae bacterium]NIT83486.1 isoprenoid biosynthesis glyoxalase ElbB [Nitrospinaceae bacterium]NIU45691.1 isoprenoid biosynthesis glyoxalase ElbB [Nitrospinaceae bacterium]